MKTIPQLVLRYWKIIGLKDIRHLYCKHCGKFMLDIDDLNRIIDLRHNKLYSYYLCDKNCQRHIESLQNRFLVNGKNFSGKIFFRQLCWDCFHEELEKTIVEKFKTRDIKYTWYRKYMKGELKNYYPVSSQSACFYFKFLFGMTDEELEKECKKFVTASLDFYIKKYGDNELARQKFEEYKKIQAKNGCSLEYFVEKYGKEEGTKKYNEVCESKGVTKKNCIEKYGYEFGKKLFTDYCKKQEYAGCKPEYFIEKYGEEEGRKKYDEVCHQKAPNLSNFIRKYGPEQGKKEYERFLSATQFLRYSIVSQRLFEEIDKNMGDSAKDSKWFLKNGEAEFEIKISDKNGNIRTKFAKPDYLLGNKILEFQGDYWHFNPKYYSADESRYAPNGELVFAEEIWENDKKRKIALENLGMSVKFIWEDEYQENPEKVINECCDFLRNS